MIGHTETDNEGLRIETPEQVNIRFRLAGLGSRGLAFLLDTAVRFLLILIVFGGALFMATWLPSLDPTGFLPALPRIWLVAMAVMLYGVVDLGYFLLFEALWSGQTPGKRILNIRVIQSNGRPIGWFESAVRNILRAVDMPAGVYPLGLIVMFFSAGSQRIGDYAAGTMVVREQKSLLPGARRDSQAAEVHRIPGIEMHMDTLDKDEYRLIRSFLQRRAAMDAFHRSQLARTLSIRLMQKWGMSPSSRWTYEAFLEEVAVLYEKHRRVI
jgi:uncharacterized RDD family membrane protein YckC